MTDLHNFRQEYRRGELLENEVTRDAIAQFDSWMQDAISFPLVEPNAMTLVTATSAGKPSARVVLLKSFDNEGFVFFTNYNSRKGEEIAHNPYACIVFDWHLMERQVRIEGTIEKVAEEESDTYFNSRPEGSKLGAWVSPQSTTIANREELEARKLELEKKFRHTPITRPPHWGGYVVKPTLIEFWQGRHNRLHDRLVYEYKNNQWHLHRLAP